MTTEPAFTVVAGRPDDTEVAALTTVLYLCSRMHRAASDTAAEPKPTAWNHRRRHTAPAAWTAADDRHLA